jgi:hypothetical protein
VTAKMTESAENSSARAHLRGEVVGGSEQWATSPMVRLPQDLELDG